MHPWEHSRNAAYLFGVAAQYESVREALRVGKGYAFAMQRKIANSARRCRANGVPIVVE